MSPDDLLEFITTVSGDAYLKVEERLGDGYVVLRVSEAERRQAKHDIRSVEDIVVELLRNSRDAHAQKIFFATGREGDRRTLVIVDDGIGIPPAMQDRVFEPRVTSKLDTMVMDQWGVHGRGMALFSIRSNAAEARVTASEPHRGTSVTVVADTTDLPEKSDQSTWPTVERDEAGELAVTRGPHNIVRRIVEFALECPGIDLYVGTPTEVLATMSELAKSSMDSSELLFADDRSRFELWQRPAAAADAEDLVGIAESLGLPISERTAHRVIASELEPLRTVRDRVCKVERKVAEQAKPDIYRDRRGLKIHHTDLAQFRSELEHAFDAISERYYVHLRSEPKISVGRDEIRVRFEIDKED
jgi:hypothetical protein